MQNPTLQELLDKFNAGTITEEEMVLLESWYLNWQPETQDISAEELQAIKNEVWGNVAPRETTVRTIGVWPRVAAACILVAIAASAYFYFNKPVADPDSPQIQAVAPKKDFKPGGNKAILTLADGTKLSLNDAANGTIAQQGASVVKKISGGSVAYGQQHGMRSSTVSNQMNTLSTPRGGEYQLILADGTKVWLNAASSVTFPVAFSKTDRRVTVAGEVYFEVAHDAGRPFIVSAIDQEITVLGTHFNLKAYADDLGVSTTLLAGSVSIKNLNSGQTGLLIPGQQAKIYRGKGDINIKKVNAQDAISWKNGYFLFDNQEIKSIMRIMSRWYDVDIEYKNYDSHDRFGGTFSRRANMLEILNNLERIGKVHFKTEGKKVVVLN